MATNGLLGSIKKLLSTAVGILETRLELLSTDIEIGRERMLAILVMTLLALFFISFGLLFLALLVVVIFWDSNRLIAISAAALLFLIIGLGLTGFVWHTLKTMPRFFEASLAELSKDRDHLSPPK